MTKSDNIDTMLSIKNKLSISNKSLRYDISEKVADDNRPESVIK